MAELIFLPHYAQVLESVMRQVEEQGIVDVECRSDLDPAVVAGQVRTYGESTGRELRCTAHPGRVEVRTAGRRSSRAKHPAAQGA